MPSKTALLLALLLGLSAGAAPASTLVDRVVAVVNKDVVTLSEIKKFASDAGLDPEDPEVQKKALETYIEQILMEQEANKHGIIVTERDVDASIEGVKSRFNLDDEKLKAALKEQGLTYDKFRQQWKHQLLSQKLLSRIIGGSVAVTDDEILEEYKKRGGSPTQDVETRISHILIKFDSNGGEDDARKRALEVLKKAEKGEKFEKLAREYSDDKATADKGGDLGYFKKGQMAEALEKAIADAGEGTVIGPVKSSAGFHIVKVTERKTSGDLAMDEKSKEEIREEIYNRKVEESLKAWVEKVKETAYIERKL
jgi:peptidyl-prolyl cis-trans isomerase SurA